MLKVYGFPNSRSMRVVWTLEEVGAEYDYVKVDLRSGENFRSPFTALNPGGKVPALVDGDFVLTESAAICTYIGDQYPAAGLVPTASTRQRAQYHQWCSFVISELEQPLWTIGKHRFALPENRRVPAITDTALWEFSVAAKVLDKGLGDREFIVGDRFSIADILVAHTLAWAKAYKIPLGSERLDAYAGRLLARPALARAKAREQEQRE
ncbi:MAG: glutathione S-transferase family protein [Candidatus Competibacteraceae bacterium]